MDSLASKIGVPNLWPIGQKWLTKPLEVALDLSTNRNKINEKAPEIPRPLKSFLWLCLPCSDRKAWLQQSHKLRISCRSSEALISFNELTTAFFD